MSDIRLFRLDHGKATAIDGSASGFGEFSVLRRTPSEAGGFPACSRWSSAATPPVFRRLLMGTPAGVPAFSAARGSLASLRDAGRLDLFPVVSSLRASTTGYRMPSLRDGERTGDLELMIHSLSDLEKAKPYLEAAYRGESA